MSRVHDLIAEIHTLANPERARISQRFFKTGKWQYWEGDIFLGLTMPQLREIVKKYTAYTQSNLSLILSKGEGTIKKSSNKAPLSRGVAWNAGGLSLTDIDILLADKHHEVRMTGVLLLVYFVQKKIYPLQEIAECYMRNAGVSLPPWERGWRETPGDCDKENSSREKRKTEKNKRDLFSDTKIPLSVGADIPLQEGGSKTGINNWDLVDASSEHIIGPFLQHCLTHEERIQFINNCINSENLWINRIIILASFYQIKQGNGKLTFYIAERMLHHSHDLIHKAIGWMLREVGKCCSMDELRGFLDQYASTMPRTMLRYAIEHFEKHEREALLKKHKA